MKKQAGKLWYKTWWGIILAILIWPFFLSWYIWEKTKWKQGWKIIVIILIFLFVYSVGKSSSGSQATTSPPSTKTTGSETSKPTPTPEKPVELSGKGQQASAKFSLNTGLYVFKMQHHGTSNFAIFLMNSDGQKIELLVNEIGSFDGSKAVRISRAGDYLLDVTADGDWTVKVEKQ